MLQIVEVDFGLLSDRSGKDNHHLIIKLKKNIHKSDPMEDSLNEEYEIGTLTLDGNTSSLIDQLEQIVNSLIRVEDEVSNILPLFSYHNNL